MYKIITTVIFTLASTAFCVDEYQPIKKGSLEIDAGYGFGMVFASYDKDGKSSDDSGMLGTIPLQIKYGIMTGLDVELAWSGTLNNIDAGDDKGFDRPSLAIKYALPEIGAGGFLDFALPIVTGNLDRKQEPGMGVGVGAVFAKRFGNFQATALGSYQFNMKNSETTEDKAGNKVTLLFKPEAMWTEFVGTYLGIRYDMSGQSERKHPTLGEVKTDGGYLLSIIPGLNTVWLENVATEINIPITVLGKSLPASWGIAAQVYYTLPL